MDLSKILFTNDKRRLDGTRHSEGVLPLEEARSYEPRPENKEGSSNGTFVRSIRSNDNPGLPAYVSPEKQLRSDMDRVRFSNPFKSYSTESKKPPKKRPETYDPFKPRPRSDHERKKLAELSRTPEAKGLIDSYYFQDPITETPKEFVWNWTNHPDRQQQLAHTLQLLNSDGKGKPSDGRLNKHFSNPANVREYMETLRRPYEATGEADYGNPTNIVSKLFTRLVNGHQASAHFNGVNANRMSKHPLLSIIGPWLPIANVRNFLSKSDQRLKSKEGTMVHEYTHALGLDNAAGKVLSNPLYRNITSQIEFRLRAEEDFKKQHGYIPTNYEKDKYYVVDPATGNKVGGPGENYNSPYYGQGGNEILPNIMTLRYLFKLKPNQTITPMMVDTMKNILELNGKYDSKTLFKNYSIKQIADMMNSMVSNDKPRQSGHQQTMVAKNGGKLKLIRKNGS